MQPYSFEQEVHLMVALMNLAVCIGIMWFCICRLNSRASKIFLSVRVKYLLLLTGALASGLQPILWSALPDIGSFLFSLSILIYLIINKESRGM